MKASSVLVGAEQVQPEWEKRMGFVGFSGLLALFALAGCSAMTRPLEVHIRPDAYQVGSVKSALATPAVDEVVRVNPRRVLMVTCRSTPPAKIIQFEVELRARHKAELQGTLSSEGCAA
ncbi:hypothetical protein [Acidovorax sp.]|uniref:hypothetical protein n=1 Tax=Acidovorax sp. TaxID=1872122 RepID=UPI003D087D82